MSNFERVSNWLKAAGKEPNGKNLSIQIGVHLEEFTEFLRCIRTHKDGYQMLIDRCIGDLEWFAVKLKKGEHLAYIPIHLRVDALDALCDCDVTGNGVAYLAGFKKDEADQEVLRSNDSKFVDGKPVILEGGKIGKGPDYYPPQLKQFT